MSQFFPVSHIRWPKYWSFSLSITPSNKYSGVISFRINWLDLLAVQGTLKSLLQHYSSKASILLRSAFFTVQLSHPYMTTGKTIALTRQVFVGKVMSLLFSTLSRLIIAFLPRSKRILISWPQSPFTICSDFGVQENKVCLLANWWPCLPPRMQTCSPEPSCSHSQGLRARSSGSSSQSDSKHWFLLHNLSLALPTGRIWKCSKELFMQFKCF